MIGYGCGFGFPGILLPQLELPGSLINVSKNQESWLASVSSIPMVFGNFLVPVVMSRAGRKVALYAVTLILTLGWFVVIIATSYEMLLLGMMTQGFSFGMFMPLRSVYIGECSSPRYRGGFLTSSVLAQIFGILFVHFTGSLISYQLTALCSISFALISIILTVYSPESPSWLATKGQYERCRENFTWLRGEDEMPELEKMIETVNLLETQESTRSTFREMIAVVKKKEFFKPVLLLFALYIMLSCGGAPVMGAYSVTILELLMPKANANFWMVALDCQRLLFTGAAIFVVNKIKRRPMLFFIGALCAGSQLLMGAYLFAKNNDYLPFDSLWIPGVLISLQMLSISMGMQPLPAVIAGEVCPLQHRSLAGGIGLTALSVSAFIVLKTFPGLISVVGLEGTLAVYAGVIAACLAVAWVLLPETSGRTLQQIEEHFRGTTLMNPETDEEKPLTYAAQPVYFSIQK
ncbi:facilitated trehalose transporter Tret1-like [Cydia splendana]|uniref:facilitated trehalose transporter Tret1-like n=1 Tax=Cydia splendana TaxID=1100963 RepID=UPI00300D1484